MWAVKEGCQQWVGGTPVHGHCLSPNLLLFSSPLWSLLMSPNVLSLKFAIPLLGNHSLTETTWPWPGRIITTCTSYLTTGGPNKEHGTDKLLSAKRILEGPKGGREMPGHNMSCPPPRNPRTGNRLDWEIHAPPGKALNRTKYGHRWCWNLASVHRCWIKSQRQSFGWNRKQ